MRVAWIVLAIFLATPAQAAPTSFVSLDRSVWPERLDSPVLFDVASRAQILSFAQVLHESEALDEQALADRLQLRLINLQSVRAVRARMWGRLWDNYQQALQSCEQDASFCFPAQSLAELRTLAATFDTQVGAFYAGWVEPSRQFHERYLDDLLRKAALLPRLESEIQRFLDPEGTGGTFGDRLFLLSVVGGPGPMDGATETLADYLRQQQVSGLFFVLGSRWQQCRDATSAAALRERYAGHCVGLQGWEYRSHAQWQDWQASLQRSQARIQGDAPQQYVGWFRPPYGQRRQDGQAFMAARQLRVSLWDIDAQDNGPLSAEQSAQRVLSLMLLWRQGIVQFTETSAKAQPAVQQLLALTAQSGIGWADCHGDFQAPPPHEAGQDAEAAVPTEDEHEQVDH
ncbi:polysaccharide deacetylase family protein [Pseudomonas entomophila]|uniref:polysaccharide deacetylase family protein n=1 Tax=Pseudomonas entomophila TaxID=312306 RepID=UPI0015E38BCA|nr:polysaccharide deacetylase family protein [Pseudomonas entomophila]MBA1194575.1 polysaccharide deacetylase family protein [Pseudomonas entomophila]